MKCYAPFLQLLSREIKIPWKNFDEYHKKIRNSQTRAFIKEKYLDIEDVDEIKTVYEATMIILAGLHNQTINIYTSLIPFCVVIFMLLSDIFFSDNELSALPFCYGISMAVSMLFSVYYHVGCCGMPSNYMRCLKVDLFGIFCIFSVSMFSGFWLGFNCHPSLQFTYSVTHAVVCVFVLFPIIFLFENDQIPYRRKKYLFMCVMCSEVMPIIHWIYLYHATLGDFIWSPLRAVIANIVGAFFLQSSVPERFWPGKFDIFFHSHQWWHICCVISSFSWWYWLHDLTNYWKIRTCDSLLP